MLDMTTSIRTPPVTSVSGRKRPSAPMSEWHCVHEDSCTSAWPWANQLDGMSMRWISKPTPRRFRRCSKPRSRHALSSSIAASAVPVP